MAQLCMDMETLPPPEFKTPSISSFFLGFSTILFSFGGASTFPTIQNDMTDKAKFKWSIVIAFSGD